MVSITRTPRTSSARSRPVPSPDDLADAWPAIIASVGMPKPKIGDNGLSMLRPICIRGRALVLDGSRAITCLMQFMVTANLPLHTPRLLTAVRRRFGVAIDRIELVNVKQPTRAAWLNGSKVHPAMVPEGTPSPRG